MLQNKTIGKLAYECCGLTLTLEVLESRAGFYIGTSTQDGPCSRESVEYWTTARDALHALKNQLWTQRYHA
jgi:hypothetical protein